MRSFLPLILSLLVLAACSPLPGQPAGTGIEGQVFIGPTCPVVRIDTPCPDRPFQATLSVLNAQGRRVAHFRTDAGGRFRVSLLPGTYTLAPESINAMTHAPQQEFSVVPGQFTKLAVTYDSGIR
jgi:hypothetical protein